MVNLDIEEKKALAFGSIAVGAFIGFQLALVVFACCVLILPAGKSLGVAILSFFPASLLMARWNAKLYIRNKSSKEADHATVSKPV